MMFIEPEMQGKGLGTKVIDCIQTIATIEDKPIRLCAIKTNPATEFYRKLEFHGYREDSSLVYFEWILLP
jgi:GNAT superfamily N-acetyltransferase